MRSFWEEREQVERFASREPDVRLRDLIREFPDPTSIRVLDLGCAGGRNSVLLAGMGFDIRAVDASRAMVEETRRRLGIVLGPQQARRRIRRGRMDRLDWADTESFDLVVALGIYHQAETAEEWERALAESARALKSGGRTLVSVFTPETDLTGRGIRAVSGAPHVFEGFPGGGRVYLVDPQTLDSDMAQHGLSPVTPTLIVRHASDAGRRVSANALYVKSGPRV